MLYRFKTYHSEYYLPSLTRKNRFIYSLYGNYGGKLGHVLWWLFMHSRLFRWINRVEEGNVDGYAQLKELLGENCIFGINMGTKGPDQKKSILGYDYETGKDFFAKLSTTERAMSLSRNEIRVYQELTDTGLVPRLYDYKDGNDYVFLKCECIKGKHIHEQIDIRDILLMLMKLKQMHYEEVDANTGLAMCLAHMDFCPWNMLDVNGNVRVIDWEMASEMPLGFDLFTYLLQTHFLTDNNMTGEAIILANENIINEYFGMERPMWQPYLDAFIEYKIKSVDKAHGNLLLNKFLQMLGHYDDK